jgi:hypothetical protein
MKPCNGLASAVVVAGLLSALWIGLNAAKPVHTDDSFFLYWARVISPLPGDQPMKYFNWARYEEPMAAETRHAAPGWAIALSGIRHLAGERLAVLHWLQWPFAVMFLAGVFMLARTLGAPAWTAMFLCGTSPVFLLPAASLLGDIPAMGLGILGLAVWTGSVKISARLAGAVLLALAGQMKMSSLVLYPLLVIRPGGGISRSRMDWVLALSSLVFAATYPDVPPHGPESTFIAGNIAWIINSAWNPGLLSVKLSYLAASCGSLVVPVLPLALSVVFRTDLKKASDRVRVFILGICAIPLLSLAGFWKGQAWSAQLNQSGLGTVGQIDTVPPTLNTLWFYLVIALFISWGMMALRPGRPGPARWMKAWLLCASAGFLGATLFPAVRHLIPVLPALVLVFLADTGEFCGARAARILALMAIAGNLWLGLSLSINDTVFARFCVDSVDRAGQDAKARNLPLVTTASWGMRYYTEKAGGRVLESSSETLPTGAVVLVPRLTDRRVLPARLAKRGREMWAMTCPPSRKWPLILPVQTIPPVQALGGFHGGFVWFPYAFTRAPTEMAKALEIRPLPGGR